MLGYEGWLSLHIWWLIILGKGLLIISSIILCICRHICSRYLLPYSGHILWSKSISSWYKTPRASSVFTGCLCVQLSPKITSLLCTIFLFTGSHNLYPITPSSPHPGKYIYKILAHVCCVLLFECAQKASQPNTFRYAFEGGCLTMLLEGFLPPKTCCVTN